MSTLTITATDHSFQANLDDTDFAGLPKSVGMKHTTLHTVETGLTTEVGSMFVAVMPNGVTGYSNETGLRRIRRLLVEAERQGWTVDYRVAFSNSFPTLDAFLAHFDGEAR